ncbi:MAG: hypothetical protein ACRDJF_02735 [Actinomycetota bacterium]
MSSSWNAGLRPAPLRTPGHPDPISAGGRAMRPEAKIEAEMTVAWTALERK